MVFDDQQIDYIAVDNYEDGPMPAKILSSSISFE